MILNWMEIEFTFVLFIFFFGVKLKQKEWRWNCIEAPIVEKGKALWEGIESEFNQLDGSKKCVAASVSIVITI